MMPWILASIFISVLFFGYYVSKMMSAGREHVEARLARRLGGEPEKIGKIQIERQDNLSDVPTVDRLLRQFAHVKDIANWLRQSGFSVVPGVFFLSAFLLAAVFSSLCFFLHAIPLALPAAGLGMTLPFIMAGLRRASRMKRFSQVFPDAVARMASSLRAGYSLQMAFEAVVEDSNNIVGEEFRKVLAEIEVGQSFESALQKMLMRIDTADLRLFIASVTIQRESGGNLAELLDNLEATIRDRFALQNELMAASAQAKLSGIILSLLPIFVGTFVFIINRKYILFFFQDPVGQKLFWMCLAGQIMGMLLVRKIVRIQI